MKTTLCLTIFLTATILTSSPLARSTPADPDENLLTQTQIQQLAKNITVRIITTANNSGSGVIIAQKGSKYLILTNAHRVNRAAQIEIQASDGQRYPATQIDGGFDPNYDLALLQFTSKTQYPLANLASISGSPIEPERTIYSTGFPFNSTELRITKGQISQLTDLPFNDGRQIGYTLDNGDKDLHQDLSGGAILDAQGNLLGINSGSTPTRPDYIYHDGSKPIAKLQAQYHQANWGIPISNFLTNVKADILYGYANLPKVERQVTPIGYLAKLNIQSRQITVRIEHSGGNGSGVIIAREGRTYTVLTAKHAIQSPETRQTYLNPQVITSDQDRHPVTSYVVAAGVDLAVMKFRSNSNYSIARLGDLNQHNGDLAFVGGFPEREQISSPLWQWQLKAGVLADRELGKLAIQDRQSFAEGYNLIYTNISYGGMSGGPVVDIAGNVIGIHGKAESTGAGATILGNSLGISIQTFLGLAPELQISPQLLKITTKSPVGLNPSDRREVIAMMRNIPQPQATDDGKRWLAYGNQLYRTETLKLAVAAFDRAITKGEVLLGGYGKALAGQAMGEYQLAETAIAQAIAAIPAADRAKYYYFWKRQSSIFKDSGKYDLALIAIDRAISLTNNDLTLLSVKAQIFSKQHQYAQAIALYDLMIRRQPEPYIYNHRGNAKADLGDKPAAILDYNLAISIDPKFAGSYNNRGNAKADLGNKPAAILDYNLAIAIYPEYVMAYYNRGNVKSDLGKSQAAIADYDRAISLNPNLTNAYYNRGTLRSALGDRQGAIADLRQVAKLSRQQGQMNLYQEAIDLLEKMKK
jgi:tetratricopeptide (TPR) repeat protein/S1-C subfamily serine protease